MGLDSVVSALRARLPEAAFPDAAGYLSEPRGRFAGLGTVVAPGTVQEVSSVLALCHEASVPVVPHGGGTGLVGGQVKPDGPAPLVLSLQRMAAVRSVDALGGVMVAEAGVTLAEVRARAVDAGRLFPLALASEGSARIGGVLATNAGGVNVLRYGNARALCLGLEVVLADGRVWHGLSALRKDNTGYDLRDLMIGSEGTLGIITAASLRLFSPPSQVGTALLAVKDPAAALALLARAQARFGETISAFELISGQGLAFLDEVGPDVSVPLARVPWSVLIELGLPTGMDADDALEALFSEAVEAGLCHDGVVARSEAQRDGLWTIRESIPEANRRIGSVSSHDISVPIGMVPDFIARASAMIAAMGDFRINCFGHLGDGNLHYNVFPAEGRTRADYDSQRADVQEHVHALAVEMGGSFSAEHGVGRLKVGDLERFGDPVKLDLMRGIKDQLDPKGILNPGAVIRPRS